MTRMWFFIWSYPLVYLASAFFRKEILLARSKKRYVSSSTVQAKPHYTKACFSSYWH